MSYKTTLENATAEKNFKITNCVNIEPDLSTSALKDLSLLSQKLTSNNQLKLFKNSIIRSAFFIELTDRTADSENKKSDSTKYQVRWTEQLNGDIRFTSYDECFLIFETLLHKLAIMDEGTISLLEMYCKNSVYNFELPIDYISRHANPIHCASNMDIFITDGIRLCTKVRKIITDSNLNPKAIIFKKIG